MKDYFEEQNIPWTNDSFKHEPAYPCGLVAKSYFNGNNSCNY